VIRSDNEIRPLVPAFLANRHGDVAAFRRHLMTSDFAAIGALGHSLTETGRGYGFDGITEIGSAIERAAHHEDRDTVEARVTHLSEYLNRVQLLE